MIKEKLKKGFGSPNFDKKRQREIASMGGKTAHKNGNAHEWNHEEAVQAGKKGRSVRWNGKIND